MKLEDKDIVNAYIRGSQDNVLLALAWSTAFLQLPDSNVNKEERKRIVSMCRRMLEYFDNGRDN